MPMMDGTGPLGQGPGAGRGRGQGRGSGAGGGRNGMRRGACGGGRGLGRGAAGMNTPLNEKDSLEQQAGFLEQQLDRIKQRLGFQSAKAEEQER